MGGGGRDYPSVNLSTTNPTWTDMVIRDEKPAADLYPIYKSAQNYPGN